MRYVGAGCSGLFSVSAPQYHGIIPTCVPAATPPFPGLAKPPFVAWGGANVNQDLYPKVLTVGCSLNVGDAIVYSNRSCIRKDPIFF